MNNIGNFVNKMVGISVSIGAISFCVMASSMNYGSSPFPQFASSNSTYRSIATQSLSLNPTCPGSYVINDESNRQRAPQSTKSGILFKRSPLITQDKIVYGNTFTSDLYDNRPQLPIGLGFHAASRQSASYAYIGSPDCYPPSKLSLLPENPNLASVDGADLRISKPNKSRSINSSPETRSNKKKRIVGRGSRNKVQNNNVNLVVSCSASRAIVHEPAYVPQFAALSSNLSFSNVFLPVVFSKTPLPPIVPSLSYSRSVYPLDAGQISEQRLQTQPAMSFSWLADSENPYK